MYNIAIIGAGGIAHVHFQAYEYIIDARIAAVVDVDLSKARRLAARCSAASYANFEEMISNEEIHIIDICLPSYLHKEYILKAIDHNKHVICEKPIALNIKDTKEILEYKNSHKCKLMIAHCLRFADEYIYLKKQLDSGQYGKLLNLNLFRNVSIPAEMEKSWLFEDNKSGGILFDLHIHDVDILNYMLGIPKEHVTYKRKRFVNSFYRYEDCDVAVSASWRPQRSYEFCAGYDAVFEKATIISRNGEVEAITDEEKKKVSFKSEIKLKEEFIRMYYNEINYFIHCVETGEELLQCDPEDNSDSIKMIGE